MKRGLAIAYVAEIKPGAPLRFEDIKAEVQRLAAADFEASLIAQLRAKAAVEIDKDQIERMTKREAP